MPGYGSLHHTVWVGMARVPQNGTVTIRYTVRNTDSRRTFTTERADGPVLDIVVPESRSLAATAWPRWSATQSDGPDLHRLVLKPDESRTIEFVYLPSGMYDGPVQALGLVWRGIPFPFHRVPLSPELEGYDWGVQTFRIGTSAVIGDVPPNPLCREHPPYDRSPPPVRPGG
jgi:hypothetical protein